MKNFQICKIPTFIIFLATLNAAIQSKTTMQAEAKSSTSSQVILLMTLTIPRKTFTNVCMDSMPRSLRKQITWKIRFITASISSIILAKKSKMMSNNFSMVSHSQQVIREKNSTNSWVTFDIRFFIF